MKLKIPIHRIKIADDIVMYFQNNKEEKEPKLYKAKVIQLNRDFFCLWILFY